jgi:hypothetical protein
LASDSDRPEITAFLELEHLVRNVGEALASFRRRALAAEARIKDGDVGGAGGGGGDGVARRSAAELESEARELRQRLDLATERTQQMLERVRFLRQQQNRGE